VTCLHIGHKITSEHTIPPAWQVETGAVNWTNRRSVCIDELMCILDASSKFLFAAVGCWMILHENLNSIAPANWQQHVSLYCGCYWAGKGQNPLRQFPRNKFVVNKLARAKVRCVCCVVSFPKFHYNDLLSACCGLVGHVANKSATSL